MPSEGLRRRWRYAPVAWGLPAAWAGLALACGLRASRQIPDDMYITFRYAWNLAHGEGLVFNPGERVFGLTNPGHGIVLALPHGLTRVPVHVLGAVVFGAALWGLAVLLWREGRSRGAGAELAVGGTLVLGASYLWVAIGSASSSVLVLLAASALLLGRRPALAGVLAGLAVWYRPDAALGVAALGALGWLERRRPPWRWVLAAGAVVALGLAAAWLWFGSPLPDTLAAKRMMAEARPELRAGPAGFWADGAALLSRHFGPGWMLLTALGLAGLWPLFARGGLAARTLVVYGAAVAVAYPLLRVPFFQWYTVPPVTALLLGAGALAVGIGRSVAGALTPARQPAGDDLGAFLARPPDLFLDHPANPNPGIMALPGLDQLYEPVARIENPLGRDEPAVVYRKRPGAELPPPRPPAAPARPGRGRLRPGRARPGVDLRQVREVGLDPPDLGPELRHQALEVAGHDVDPEDEHPRVPDEAPGLDVARAANGMTPFRQMTGIGSSFYYSPTWANARSC